MKVMDQYLVDLKVVQGKFSAKDVSNDFIIYAFAQ
jgi:hypothetical protein